MCVSSKMIKCFYCQQDAPDALECVDCGGGVSYCSERCAEDDYAHHKVCALIGKLVRAGTTAGNKAADKNKTFLEGGEATALRYLRYALKDISEYGTHPVPLDFPYPTLFDNGNETLHTEYKDRQQTFKFGMLVAFRIGFEKKLIIFEKQLDEFNTEILNRLIKSAKDSGNTPSDTTGHLLIRREKGVYVSMAHYWFIKVQEADLSDDDVGILDLVKMQTRTASLIYEIYARYIELDLFDPAITKAANTVLTETFTGIAGFQARNGDDDDDDTLNYDLRTMELTRRVIKIVNKVASFGETERGYPQTSDGAYKYDSKRMISDGDFNNAFSRINIRKTGGLETAIVKGVEQEEEGVWEYYLATPAFKMARSIFVETLVDEKNQIESYFGDGDLIDESHNYGLGLWNSNDTPFYMERYIHQDFPDVWKILQNVVAYSKIFVYSYQIYLMPTDRLHRLWTEGIENEPQKNRVWPMDDTNYLPLKELIIMVDPNLRDVNGSRRVYDYLADQDTFIQNIVAKDGKKLSELDSYFVHGAEIDGHTWPEKNLPNIKVEQAIIDGLEEPEWRRIVIDHIRRALGFFIYNQENFDWVNIQDRFIQEDGKSYKTYNVVSEMHKINLLDMTIIEKVNEQTQDDFNPKAMAADTATKKVITEDDNQAQEAADVVETQQSKIEGKKEEKGKGGKVEEGGEGGEVEEEGEEGEEDLGVQPMNSSHGEYRTIAERLTSNHMSLGIVGTPAWQRLVVYGQGSLRTVEDFEATDIYKVYLHLFYLNEDDDDDEEPIDISDIGTKDGCVNLIIEAVGSYLGYKVIDWDLDDLAEYRQSEGAQTSQMDKAMSWMATVRRETFSTTYRNVTVNRKSTFESIASSLDALDNLVALKELKDMVVNKINEFMVRPEEFSRINHSAVFWGNPGTGKTESAKRIQQIYYHMGFVLKKPAGGGLAILGSSDFIGEYKGRSEPKTRRKMADNFGGMMFIDEAYNLIGGKDDDFGKKAIAEIARMMTAYKNFFIVIMAGYRESITNNLFSIQLGNRGLASRFPERILFENYNALELMQIMYVTRKEMNVVIDPVDIALLYQHFTLLHGYKLAKEHKSDETYNLFSESNARAMPLIIQNARRYNGTGSSFDKFFTDMGVTNIQMILYPTIQAARAKKDIFRRTIDRDTTASAMFYNNFLNTPIKNPKLHVMYNMVRVEIKANEDGSVTHIQKPNIKNGTDIVITTMTKSHNVEYEDNGTMVSAIVYNVAGKRELPALSTTVDIRFSMLQYGMLKYANSGDRSTVTVTIQTEEADDTYKQVTTEWLDDALPVHGTYADKRSKASLSQLRKHRYADRQIELERDEPIEEWQTKSVDTIGVLAEMIRIPTLTPHQAFLADRAIQKGLEEWSPVTPLTNDKGLVVFPNPGFTPEDQDLKAIHPKRDFKAKIPLEQYNTEKAEREEREKAEREEREKAGPQIGDTTGFGDVPGAATQKKVKH